MAHHHHPEGLETGDSRIVLAVGVNLSLTAAQVIGGLFAGSLSLIADALHNLSDAISLIIAYAARKVARRPSDESMTFGYGRVEMVAALVNYTTLILVGLYLAYEALTRFFHPQSVDGWIVVIIAGIALAVDAITAALTYTLSKQSINMRAAFLHNLTDALSSIAVMLAGTLILLFDWWLIDPIVTLGISAYILWLSFSEMGSVIRILMLGSPPDVDTHDIINTILEVEGIKSVHHAHFWQLNEHSNAMDAHLVIAEGCWHTADAHQVKSSATTEKRSWYFALYTRDGVLIPCV